MRLDEYKLWLEEHANKEERRAYDIAEQIVDYHLDRTFSNMFKNVEIFPRKKFKGIEFDLLIYIYAKSKKPAQRTREDILIGVEFKETDLNKVIAQAVMRREFVDYMYIATRCRSWDIQQIFLMALFGIGWFYWDNNFVKLILEPRRYANKVNDLLDYLFDSKLEKLFDEAIDRKLKSIEERVQRRLDEWSPQTK